MREASLGNVVPHDGGFLTLGNVVPHDETSLPWAMLSHMMEM